MTRNKILWGIIFLLGAVALIAYQMEYFTEVNIFSIIVSIILLGVIVMSIFVLNFVGIFFPLAIIIIIYDDVLGLTTLTPWTVLIAALFGSIGCWLIFNKRLIELQNKQNWNSSVDEIIEKDDEGHVKFQAVLGWSSNYVNTDKLEQVDLRCRFGGIEVYFDKAKLHNGKGIIRVDLSFGGMELYIPKEWTVENNVKVVLGAVEEKGIARGKPDNHINIIGNVSFGSVEIIYV